jgi:serine phosphatase RsbU (regulator of sigma subunit)
MPEAVLCVGGRSLPDELAAAMLAQLLHRRGFLVARSAAATLERNELPSVSGAPVRILAICSVHSSAILQIRRIVRRLRPRLGGARIVACVLNGQLGEQSTSEAMGATTADLAAATLADAVTQVERLALAEQGAPAEAVGAGADTAPEELDAAQCRLLNPAEIDEPQAYLCHGCWQAQDGGGDFAEAHRRTDGMLVGMMAALSSESPAAASLIAAIRTSLDAHAEEVANPAELLEGIEKDLAPRADPGEAVSAIAFIYRPDRRLLLVSSAGNPEPILLRGETAEPVPVPAGAPLLGLREAPEEARARRFVELVLETGDRVLFYSEGAIEIAHPERGFLEPAGLAGLAREQRGFAGLSFLEHLIASIRAFGEGEPEDDIVLLTLEVREAATVGKLPNAAD